jgi:hypothetical protein
MALHCIVVWERGDKTVRHVGPTSEQIGLLRRYVDEVLGRGWRAAIVPWDMRAASVRRVEALIARRKAEWSQSEEP